MRSPVEVAPGVHRFGSARVNWYAVVDGDAVTLVDTGFPRHWTMLGPGLERLGRRISDVVAVVLTHSHVDHTGFARRLATQYTVPVFVERHDAVHGVRRFPPLHLYARPSSWGLLAEGLRDGMMWTPRVGASQPVRDGVDLDVPGRPTPLWLGGHTPGSTVYVLPERGVVFTGDSLVTFDPYTQRRGPQLMLCGVQHDEAGAAEALVRLASADAATVLPGHGAPWTEGTASACERALATHTVLHPEHAAVAG
jgi:glyoxylase-like metal-dependent hydrolase (beta-lactamase superfamily II)